MLAPDPLIGVAYTSPFLTPAFEHLARMAGGSAAHLLVRPIWDGREVLWDYAAQVRALTAASPNVHVTFAAATAEDDALYRRSGFGSIWCNHNAFVDETLFAPAAEAKKLYDAVYVGRLSAFKRHELAARVPRIAVLSTPFGVEEPYAADSVAAYEDLRFVNYEPGVGVTNLEPTAVQAVVAASRCGLALSALEGAMYGSIEYLLCGLPVVTTPSRGGRDAFFHPDYVETVDAEPGAVAAGVARIIERRIDPGMIRKRTIALMREHRARLIMWMSGIAQRNVFPEANPELWLPSFSHKLQTWRSGEPVTA